MRHVNADDLFERTIRKQRAQQFAFANDEGAPEITRSANSDGDLIFHLDNAAAGENYFSIHATSPAAKRQSRNMTLPFGSSPVSISNGCTIWITPLCSK